MEKLFAGFVCELSCLMGDRVRSRGRAVVAVGPRCGEDHVLTLNVIVVTSVASVVTWPTSAGDVGAAAAQVDAAEDVIRVRGPGRVAAALGAVRAAAKAVVAAEAVAALLDVRTAAASES